MWKHSWQNEDNNMFWTGNNSTCFCASCMINSLSVHVYIIFINKYHQGSRILHIYHVSVKWQMYYGSYQAIRQEDSCVYVHIMQPKGKWEFH
jgi:hypothetical protein